MSDTFIPAGYRPLLDLKQTEMAIKEIKDFFQLSLSSELRLRRVTAPLFVRKGTGINDDLTGMERPVSFPVKGIEGSEVEVVQSLAKWKRMALADYGIEPGYGIYTDMNAIRPDEDIDNIHSIYVDQWDWEKVISEDQRNLEYLKKTVTRIFEVMKRTEFFIYELHPAIRPVLPDRITFIHSEELLQAYPGADPEERENRITEKHGAVFVTGIGAELSDGNPHDRRAPDYDDWSSSPEGGYPGLNGDILVWNPVLETAYEISSMGIRVTPESLSRQLELCGETGRKKLLFHRRLLNNEFPLSIGGGIGQSRLCMYFLRKAHIGEIQSSIWPEEMVRICRDNGITLL
jgi:aspartate--ammonia ligase